MLGLFLLLLAGFVGTNLYVEHGALEKREQDRLLTQTRVIAENMEAGLSSANLALEAIRGQYIAERRYSSSPDLIVHLQMLVDAMPGIRTFIILDEHGKMIISNRAELIGRNFGHREYFTAAKARPDPATLYVSPPFETVFGVYAINITRAIIGPQGEFRGIVTATLDPGYFRNLMDSVLYAPDMWDALAHGDGTLFLMQPERETLRGMNLAQPGSFFMQHRASGRDVSIMSGTVYSTGEQRLMAQRTVNPAALKMDVPLVVAVSRDLDAVYQPWWQHVFFQLAMFAIVAGMSLLGMSAYQRRHRKLEQQTAAARAMADRFSLALDRIPTYIYMKDRRHRYVYANKPTLELFGCTAEDLAGSSDARFFPPEAVARLHEIDSRVLDQGTDSAEEVVVDTPDGKRRVYWEIKTPIYEGDDRSRIWGLCGISTDITERKALEGQLEQQAHLDYLTGLYNRRHFMEQGETELSRAQRHGRALTIFMLDIDHFKQFNDTYGHKAGDQVLQKLAEVMRGTLRTVDILGRIGGEEFAVLLPETELAEAVEVAERLRLAVEQTAVVFEAGLPQHFTVSIGVTTQRKMETNLDILLSEADRALYRAKEAGRNRVDATTDGAVVDA